jgi:hypothetical protein
MNRKAIEREFQYEDGAVQNFQRIKQKTTPKRSKFAKKRTPVRRGIKERHNRQLQW